MRRFYNLFSFLRWANNVLLTRGQTYGRPYDDLMTKTIWWQSKDVFSHKLHYFTTNDIVNLRLYVSESCDNMLVQIIVPGLYLSPRWSDGSVVGHRHWFCISSYWVQTFILTFILTNQQTNTRDALASLGYSDRCICCDDSTLTSLICDAQQWRHRMACQFLDVVLLWLSTISFVTTSIRCSL